MGLLARLGLGGPASLRARARMRSGAPGIAIVRITRNAEVHELSRSRHALLIDDWASARSRLQGFAALLSPADWSAAHALPSTLCVEIPPALSYLDDGDVVRIDSHNGHLDVIYRRWSEHNSILLTERCNSRCVMCSQPPITRDDSYLLDEVLQAIPLMHPETREIGITGGEPTLLGSGLVRVIQTARDALPNTTLHILSNGRLFVYAPYVADIAAARHSGVVFGIPVYSDIPRHHDFVVQAGGAFDQTVRGLLNLARYGVRVELRVVVHKLTYRRLPQLAAFIARNLGFAEHIALMGLEPIGYARANMEGLWVDPIEYQRELTSAIEHMHGAGLNVSIYNHPLCLLPPALWTFARRSISDWKNVYDPVCTECLAKPVCSGFFASSTFRRSANVRAITGAFHLAGS